MKILITGATGFVGSHLCRHLVAGGHDVRILCRSTSDGSPLDGLAIDRVVGDITDYGSVEKAVWDRDWVVHAAAHIAYRPREAAEQARVNVDGTRHVAQACREARVKRLVHVSSVAAVGLPRRGDRPADEHFAFNVDGRLPYHVSKRRAEDAIMTEVAHGLDAVIVNPSSIFGRHATGYRGGEMVHKVRRGPVVPYFTGGICVVHVADVVAGIVAALELGSTGHRYILGGENVTFRSLAERAVRAMGIRRRFVPIPSPVTALAASVLERWATVMDRPPRITWATHYCASRYQFYDSSKARRELGYRARDFATILLECLRFGA